MKGLIIKPKWADLILNGLKTWEIRGSATKIRGTIGIIKSGTGQIWGTVDLVDCRELEYWEFECFTDHHQVQDVGDVSYKRTFAWILKNPVKYIEPVAYNHPQGAIIWVNLGYKEME